MLLPLFHTQIVPLPSASPSAPLMYQDAELSKTVAVPKVNVVNL